ncbi:MAG: hypothetical protein ACHQ1H_02880 [Nitrososphaerales archaeon]
MQGYANFNGLVAVIICRVRRILRFEVNENCQKPSRIIAHAALATDVRVVEAFEKGSPFIFFDLHWIVDNIVVLVVIVFQIIVT